MFIVFDLFTNLEKFVTAARKAGGVLPFIAQYYMYQTILFFDRIGGMLALVSAMFTVSWIQRHNEMTALMAAGVSRIRVLLPIIIAVAVVSLLSAANREILMPRYRHELSRRPKIRRAASRSRSNRVTTAGPTCCWAARTAYADEKRIEEPRFPHAAEPAATTAAMLTADNAYYKPPDGRSSRRIPVRRRAPAEEPRHPAVAAAERPSRC